MSCCSSALAATLNISEICNQGTAPLYFATVAEFDNLLRSDAMTQGLVEVPPDQCRDLVPNGMNKVMLAFFQRDSRGLVTNSYLTVEGVTRVRKDVRHVCVNMNQPYRLFGTVDHIRKTYINNERCPEGFSRATPSWVHQPGGLATYNIEVHANQPARAWKDRQGKTFTAVPVLRTPSRLSAGRMIEANPMTLLDIEAAKALAKAGSEYLQERQAAAEQERKRRARIQQQKNAQYQAKVQQAEASLNRPPDAVCASYSPKTRYRNAKDVAISGVSLGMDLGSAHKALICNGFAVDATQMARAGGVERFWAYPRPKTFTKKLEDGTLVTTEVETRPPRGATPGTAPVVLSVRLRYRYPQPLSAKAWDQIRQDIKRRYAVGRWAQQGNLMFNRFGSRQSFHSLQLNAETRRPGDPVYQYSLSLI